ETSVQNYKLFQSDDASNFEHNFRQPGAGFRAQTLLPGKSNGVQVVTLSCSEMEVDVIPGRGMGIHCARRNGTRFGWNSPVDGPVNPALVPVNDASGIGWLEGFDEMVVRCGLLSNGAPQFDEHGNVVFPVHGRIANLPATDVDVTINEQEDSISVRGVVNETRFLIYQLKLETTITICGNRITISDRVTNSSGTEASFQMLYHNNFGEPVLGDGAEFKAPVVEVAPRDARAAEGINDWQRFSAPQAGYAEQVYFMKLSSGNDGQVPVVVRNNNTQSGVLLRYDANVLPCFTLWKNTAAREDGYVFGIEPATNFPNARQFEEDQGRVVQLAPGAAYEMSLSLELLLGSDELTAATRIVDSVATGETIVHESPRSGWSPGLDAY
ncbi:MAG: aldose 1-epimerase family protein, partial [Planctomycetota bacterium]